MSISPRSRKLLLSLHVLTSIGWAGALAVFLAHAAATLWSSDPATAAGLGVAMGITAWTVILPLSFASFATGVAQSLLSSWGLLRHHWIAFKLALTAVATIVLLTKLGPISELASRSVAGGGGELTGLRASLALHAAGGLAILIAATLLAVYKPAGLTWLGANRRGQPGARSPRWARAGWAAAAVFALLLLAMVVVGQHGPGAHFSH